MNIVKKEFISKFQMFHVKQFALKGDKLKLFVGNKNEWLSKVTIF